MSTVGAQTLPFEIRSRKQEGLKRVMEISVPDHYRCTQVAKQKKKIKSQINMKGFRSGNMPEGLLEKRYGKRILKEVTSQLVEDSCREAFEQEKCQPIVSPHIEVKQDKVGKPIEYTVEFEVYPDIELQPFDDITLEKWEVTVDENDVERVVDNILEKYATLKKIDTPAKQGDRLSIDFKGTLNGEVFSGSEANDFKLKLGKGDLLHDFERQLIGCKAGEHKTFDLHFPADYHMPALADKTCVFDVTIREISMAELPELNEEFLLEKLPVSNGKLSVLRQNIREELLTEAEKISKEHIRNQLIEKLLEIHIFDLPTSLLERYKDSLGKEKEKGDIKQTEEGLKEKVEKDVKLFLLINAIAKKNNIAIDEKEVHRDIRRCVAQFPDAEKRIESFYKNQENMTQLRMEMLEAEVLDYIIKKVKLVEKKVNYQSLINKE